MKYVDYYYSPIGKIILTANDKGLTALVFDSDKHFSLDSDCKQEYSSHIAQTIIWLDRYFKGLELDSTPPLDINDTPLRMSIWNELMKIPYGKTATYGEIAKTVGTSARVVGNAMAHNKISIIIPCHRVVGSNGDLTGYSGGIDKKIKLLSLENVEFDKKGRVINGK